jgi:anti-sigma B factor antagonist
VTHGGNDDATAGTDRLHVEQTTFGATPGLALAGDLDFGTARVLDARLREVAGDGLPDLVVDVSRLGQCDSAGLSVLIGAARRALAHDGRVELRGVGGSLHRLLEVTGIGPLFRRGDSADRADAVG